MPSIFQLSNARKLQLDRTPQSCYNLIFAFPFREEIVIWRRVIRQQAECVPDTVF